MYISAWQRTMGKSRLGQKLEIELLHNCALASDPPTHLQCTPPYFVGISEIKEAQSIVTSWEICLLWEFHTHVMWTDLPPIWVCSAEASLNQLVHPRNAQNQCTRILSFSSSLFFACFQITIYTKKYLTHGEQEGTMGEVSRQWQCHKTRGGELCLNFVNFDLLSPKVDWPAYFSLFLTWILWGKNLV